MKKGDNKLTHIRDDGSAAMVDVSDKSVSKREAIAIGAIQLQSATIAAITDQNVPKGDVLAVARIAGIQAAKKTADLIPLCHQLPLSKVEVDFTIKDAEIQIRCLAKTEAKTGVEMEALTGVSVAALTIYDMCKAIDKKMVIREVILEKKTKQSV